MKAEDNSFPYVTLAEQASTPSTPASGKSKLYRKTDNKQYILDDGGAEVEIGGSGFSAYSAYTATLTAATTNPTLGSGGSASGRYAQSNKVVTGNILITCGTSGFNAGSGSYRFLLPVAASTTHGFHMFGPAYWSAGGVTAMGWATGFDSTHIQLLNTSAAAMGSSNGFTNNDLIIIQFTYEAA